VGEAGVYNTKAMCVTSDTPAHLAADRHAGHKGLQFRRLPAREARAVSLHVTSRIVARQPWGGRGQGREGTRPDRASNTVFPG